MAYLGNRPGFQYQATTVQQFSGDGSTVDFTLNRKTTTNDCEVFVENVQQEPSVAYGIGGATLTFTAAPPSGTDNIYVIFRQKATVRTNTADKYNATLFQNPKTISEDIAVDAGFNACVAGPITVSAGVTLGVPTGSRLVIV